MGWYSVDSRGKTNLTVMVGSGFGHWGLFYSRDANFNTNNSQNTYIPWKDGLYFWWEGHL
jgi:hypothetical protein